jgi:hypothetical protein
MTGLNKGKIRYVLSLLLPVHTLTPFFSFLLLIMSHLPLFVPSYVALQALKERWPLYTARFFNVYAHDRTPSGE